MKSLGLATIEAAAASATGPASPRQTLTHLHPIYFMIYVQSVFFLWTFAST